MSWWYRLQRFFFYRALKQLTPKVEHKFMTLSKSITMGIVFDGTAPADRDAVAQFVQQMQQQNIIVEVLTFLPDTKTELLPPNSFSAKQTGWNFVPNTNAVRDFTAKRFDILFALFKHENLPLEYVALTSNAVCRIGNYQLDKTNCFELMVKPEQGCHMDSCLKQAINLLNHIKND